MIGKIIEVENILDSDFNDSIIETLKVQRSWQIDPIDSIYPVDTKFQEHYYAEKYSDSGFILQSYSKYQDEYMNTHNNNLNVIAKLIVASFLKKLQKGGVIFDEIDVNRFYWNYYNRSSCGKWHQDFNEPNFCSLIYYLNTCDGYTEFEDRKIISNAGKAVMFDSHLWHRGMGPTKNQQRYTLNIIFEYKLSPNCMKSTNEYNRKVSRSSKK
jgi:hypothetical protein